MPTFSTTAKGYPYILGTQNASLIDDYALELANKLDTAVPNAFAAGTTTITISAAVTGSASITFPVGRFGVAPILLVTNAGGTGSSQVYLGTSSITASGATVAAYQRDNASVTASISVHWMAVQMLTGTAAG